MPNTVHCRLCGKAIKGRDFAERMAKLRHHRKLIHPTAHKRSVAKAMVTKGYDKKWKKRATLDPLKKRRGLIKKPKVSLVIDYKGSGLVRTLTREDLTVFPEFAFYPTHKKHVAELKESLKFAGFNEESKGKWVLRTNKFNIFVYI